VRRLAAIVMLAASLASCAYYNTYYLARKNYFLATEGLPYPVEKPNPGQSGTYQKSIDYAKKVIANYPESKWVDDAYLIWARSLLGKGDPLQTVNMLSDFPTRFPESPLRNEATFYLGIGYRQGRKYRESLVALDEYLQKAAHGDLAAYAHLERSRALMSLARAAEAESAAARVIDDFPKSTLVVQARTAHAEAALAAGDPAAARADYTALGLLARDDEERLKYLLREADCLEAARDYGTELALLNDALSHEIEPQKGAPAGTPTGPGGDHFGQLTLRIGTAHLLAGHHDQALGYYKMVIDDYPKTALSAEAQYRIAYAYETVLDDFDRARQEYAKVREQSINSPFYEQANDRLGSLERLARYRNASGDSLGRKLEAGFLLAEQYLFELDKPERALEAYAEIAHDYAGTPSAAKALNAQAWVLRRKLERPAQADSLLWAVVHQYPATEAQLAARDYLEAAGQQVPDGLIKMPEPELAAVDSTPALTAPPEGPTPLGTTMPVAGTPGVPGAPGTDPALAADPDSLPPSPDRPDIGPPAPRPTAGRVAPPGAQAPPAGPTAQAPPPTASTGSNKAPAPQAGARSDARLDDPPRPPPDNGPAAPDSSRIRP